MPSSRIYWDSACFLSYLNEEEGRAEILEALLDQAEEGEFSIVTSMVALAEVAYTASERKGAILSQEDEEAIDALLGNRSAVLLIEFNEGIARRARNLMRDAVSRGWSLRPMDAIHLASAQFAGVRELQTYDDKLVRFGQIVGFAVGPPSGANLPLDLDVPHE